MEKSTSAVLTDLLSAPNAREFLTRAFASAKAADARFGYAELARRSGISSRSHVRDLLTGKKALTSALLPKLARGFSLRGEAREYFIRWSRIEGKDLAERKVRDERKRLLKLRERLEFHQMRGADSEKGESLRTFLFSVPNRLKVYASLPGPSGRTATVDRIAEKTGMPEAVCAAHLRSFVREGLLEVSGEGYRLLASHLTFSGLPEHSEFFRLYREKMRESADRCVGHWKDPTSLFYFASLSIDPDRAAEFRQELRALLVRFVDSAENGDRGEGFDLTVGFLPRKSEN